MWGLLHTCRLIGEVMSKEEETLLERVRTTVFNTLMSDIINDKLSRHIEEMVEDKLKSIGKKIETEHKTWRKLVLKEKERAIEMERHALCVEELLQRMIEVLEKKL